MSRLQPRSRRARKEHVARAECRALVIERDLGDHARCVFHRILDAYMVVQPCGVWSGVEVHEVVTRARGGSKVDPMNCVALCHSGHAWVTAHPSGAEHLGLMLPSWATDDGQAEAVIRRMRWCQRRPPAWSSIRFDEPIFQANATRDLAALGIEL